MGSAITFLFIALEKYQQEATDSRAQKSGRFTMRNRFISEYIYETTGKCRTPKQVGGRLQRLRDICKGDKGKQFNIRKFVPPTDGLSLKDFNQIVAVEHL